VKLYDPYGVPISPSEEPSKNPPTTPPREEKRRRQAEEETKQRKRLLLPLISAATTLFGVLAGIVTFWPRPVVSAPSASFDTSNAMSISFDISNQSFIPLDRVVIGLGIGQIVSFGNRKPTPGWIPDPSYRGRLVFDEWSARQIAMDERFTINLTSVLRGPIAYADIAIVVNYRPWIMPVNRQKAFRFVTYKETDGSTHWRSWPVNKAAPRIDWELFQPRYSFGLPPR
jgi:hypothetical protein